MPQEGFKRKLTADFSADTFGYSRLIAEDEVATFKTIVAYRKNMSSLILVKPIIAVRFSKKSTRVITF